MEKLATVAMEEGSMEKVMRPRAVLQDVAMEKVFVSELEECDAVSIIPRRRRRQDMVKAETGATLSPQELA